MDEQQQAAVAAVRAGCPLRPAATSAATTWVCFGEPTEPAGAADGAAATGWRPCPASRVLLAAAGADLGDGAQVGVFTLFTVAAAAQPGLLCEAATEALLVVQSRLAAWLHASTARATVALATHAAGAPVLAFSGLPVPGPGSVSDAGRDSVALALRVSTTTAANRLAAARRLLSPGHAPLLAALHTGQTSTGHAYTVQAETARLPDPLAAAVLAHPRLARSLRHDTPGRTAALARGLAAELDPDHLAHTEHRDERDRDAVLSSRDGQVSIHAPTTSADADVARTAFRAAVAAARDRGDTRPAAHIRHDLLLDPLWQQLGLHRPTNQPTNQPDPPTEPPTAQDPATGNQPTVGEPAVPVGSTTAEPDPALVLGITVSLETLAGLAHTSGRIGRYGPLTAELARLLATQAHRVQLLAHDAGGTLVYASHTARFTHTAARVVRARYGRTCTFPGCHQPPDDTDHRQPHAHGGETSLANAVPTCRRHHRLKTHWGWTNTVDHHTGLITWTSPTGHTSSTHAHTWTPEPALPQQQRCTDCPPPHPNDHPPEPEPPEPEPPDPPEPDPPEPDPHRFGLPPY